MHRHSILLIEDEPELATLLQEILASYEVRWAPTFAEAKQSLQDFSPCLVISDLTLPDVERSGVVSRIRNLAPEVPIILMSAIAPGDLEAIATEGGVEKVIPKPFDIEELESSLVFRCPTTPV